MCKAQWHNGVVFEDNKEIYSSGHPNLISGLALLGSGDPVPIAKCGKCDLWSYKEKHKGSQWVNLRQINLAQPQIL